MDTLATVDAAVRACTLCPLSATRANAVPGQGADKPLVMFVGEGPGAQEDATGIPFAGRAGKLLDELLQSINYLREDVFITNVVKCRPPGNRDPRPEEAAACRPYLDRQIELLDPALIVTLGRHALGHFRPGARITASHGQTFPHEGRTLLPLYHPAAALRSPEMSARLRQDFAKIPSLALRHL